MKITKLELRNIIKEELEAVLSEQSPGGRINAPKITQDLMSLYKDYKNTEKYVSGPMPDTASQEYGYFMQSEEKLSDLRSKLATMLQDPDTLRALQATGKTKEAQAIQQDLAASEKKRASDRASAEKRTADRAARVATSRPGGGYRLE
tara:strand:+ start:335 stop:778 length:444 start_codon:yes stop_codon:yes gene_type:complete